MADHDLAKLNSATLGATMPEITIADGTVVQTGTVGAHAVGDEAAMASLREAMRAPMAMLYRIGLFETLFTAREPVDGAGENEGRRVFGKMFLDCEAAQWRAVA